MQFPLVHSKVHRTIFPILHPSPTPSDDDLRHWTKLQDRNAYIPSQVSDGFLGIPVFSYLKVRHFLGKLHEILLNIHAILLNTLIFNALHILPQPAKFQTVITLILAQCAKISNLLG